MTNQVTIGTLRNRLNSPIRPNKYLIHTEFRKHSAQYNRKEVSKSYTLLSLSVTSQYGTPPSQALATATIGALEV